MFKRISSLIFAACAVLWMCCGCELFDDDEALPASVTTSEDYYVSFTGATVFASFEGKIGENVEFGAYYGTGIDDMTSFAVSNEPPVDNVFKVEISGLQPGTRYFLRPVVKSASGEIAGDAVERITFTEGPVDLGLPSGLKWAACNMGAEIPSDFGDYYAWAETETKVYYNWYYYKYADGDQYHILKYSVNPPIAVIQYEEVDEETGEVVTKIRTVQGSTEGIDNKSSLDAEDDVAKVKLGGSWRIPSADEAKELIEECDGEYRKINGVWGTMLMNRNEMDERNALFIPEAKYKYNNNLCNGSYFWTSSLGTHSNAACSASIKGDLSYVVDAPRYMGQVIRPVCE